MYKAVNWNRFEDSLSKTFWEQNIRQFWVDEEISISDDKNFWDSSEMTNEMKDTYEKICVTLTTLDTFQAQHIGEILVPKIENLHNKAIMQYIGFMEQMHAKSYSTIFSTFSNTKRINELFNWAQTNENVQNKLELIEKIYRNNDEDTQIRLWKAYCGSVLLESLLFYSGFFYPLYLAGQGKLVNSCEIFNLIIRDESVHGVFSGYLAQKIYETFDANQQEKLHQWLKESIYEIVEIEIKSCKELYEIHNLENDVINFVKYNSNKSLMNLGFEELYELEEDSVNQIVLNGLKTDTKNHDFFSVKGNGYIKNVRQLKVSNQDFKW